MKKITCDCCGEPIIEPPVEAFDHTIELQTVKGGTLVLEVGFCINRKIPVFEGDQPWDAASFDICVACQLAAIHRATKTIMKFSPCEWPAALVCLGPYRHEAKESAPLCQSRFAFSRCKGMLGHEGAHWDDAINWTDYDAKQKKCESTYAGNRCQGLAGHAGNHGCAGAHWNDFDAKTMPHGPHGGVE